MAMKKKSAEFQAGIVVLVGLAILAGGLYWVSGGEDQFRDKVRYTVHFRNSGGIGNGDAVYVAGQKAGSVVELRPVDLEVDGGTDPYVAVEIELFENARVYEDSKFRISQTITGIRSMTIDYGETSEVRATPDSRLMGERLDTFEEMIDKSSRLLDDAGRTLAELEGLVADARRSVAELDVATIQAKVEDVLDKLDTASGRAAGLVGAVEQDWTNAIGPSVKEAAEKAAALSGGVERDWRESLGPRAETILDRAGEAAVEVRDTIRENREGIKRIVQQADDATRRLAPVLETIESMVRELDGTLIEVRPKLVRAMDRAKGAMANFAAVTEDLKSAPWKLVNKPSDAESDAVHLYNASRLYIEAASQIGDNIQDIKALERLGALEDEESRELVDRAIEVLEQSLSDFETRQAKLVEVIRSTAGK